VFDNDDGGGGRRDDDDDDDAGVDEEGVAVARGRREEDDDDAAAAVSRGCSGAASNEDTAADLTLENDGVGSAAGVEAAMEARRRVRTRCGAAGPLVSNSSLAYPYSCGDDTSEGIVLT
jgi:hypothetical protein